MQPFTENFPRADIYELLSPDLLHQMIKGTFKDHLVTWIDEYLKEKNPPEKEANRIISIIDRRYYNIHLFSVLVYLHIDREIS
jgi:hypothetical protein